MLDGRSSSPVPSLVLASARKLDAEGRVDDFWLRTEGGTIVAVGTGAPAAPPGTEIIDLGGDWLTPGFLDLHVHGGGGHGFDGGPDALRLALAAHRRHGTTRSLVSFVADPIDTLVRNLQAVALLAAEDPLVLGAHLEGPFLAVERHGAHNPEFLRDPSPDLVSQLLDAAGGTLRQVTIAPELPGAKAAIAAFAGAGVRVALGHTEADYALARQGFDQGATLLTHAFNAMPGIHHRAPGPILAAVDDERVTLELILDGHHVHPSVAGMLFAAAPGRVALVTDAMSAAGAGDGSYLLGSLHVQTRDGVAYLDGTTTIAGSTLTQDIALRTAVEECGLDPVAAVAALTRTPARALGIERRHGLLAPGFAADAVRLRRDWSVSQVWAEGRPVG